MSSRQKGTGACPTEQQEQEAVFAWGRDVRVLRARPELAMLVSTQTGLRTSIGAAMKAKRAGMPKGFPDIALLVPRSFANQTIWHGLFIELKRVKGGVVSQEQHEWIEKLASWGYAAVICKGARSAIDTIEFYLDYKIAREC